MFRPLRLVFERIVKRGDLSLTDASGQIHRFGDGSGPPVRARITDKALERHLVRDPALALGEAYMDGRFVVENGTIYRFLDILLRNAQGMDWPRAAMLAEVLRHLAKRVQQFNTLARSRRNVAHHYDIDRRIYELFLDPDFQYSCAYFEQDDTPLEVAQLAKKRHLAAKLDIREGHEVLDIGSGWGGLALYMARRLGARVTGITLSEEQLGVARERAAKLGLANRAVFELKDYRKLDRTFDRIVSVGMFEHVGVTHYPAFFRTLAERLREDGVAVIHSIGRFDGPAVTSPFIAKYIFPGGYIPALSEVLPAIERAGLIITDIEVLRLHYAETLRQWRHRFRANWDRALTLKDERFCRMWEFYLAASEAAFRYQNLMVFQIQLTKDQTVLPLTRDYMYAAEQRLDARDRAIAEGPRLVGE